MTEHNMPMLTDEKRQWLIDECTADMQRYTSASPRYLVAQIALAALAAEPDYWQFKYQRSWIGTNEIAMRELVKEGNEVRPLYLAPPVPALKLPDEKEQEVMSMYGDGLHDGYHQCLAEIKALNGVTE